MEDTPSDVAPSQQRSSSHQEVQATRVLIEALRQVFGENTDSGRFIDVTKIPLICRSITDIHQNISEIKLMMENNDRKYVNGDQFWPVKTIVYGGIGAAGLSIVGFVMSLIFK